MPLCFLTYRFCKEKLHEKNVSAQQDQACPHAWFPRAYEQRQWACGDSPPPCQRSCGISALTWPKRHRLLRRPDFTLCYDGGRRFLSRHFIVIARKREHGEVWRVGFAVSKKVGIAVVRNRVKRVLREFFRINQAQIPPAIDIVVIPRRSLNVSALGLALASSELLPVLETLRTVDESAEDAAGSGGFPSGFPVSTKE